MRTVSPSEPPAEAVQSRRFFLAGMFSFVVSLILIGLGSFRFMIPNVQFGKPRRFRAGMPEDLPDKTATFLPEHKVFIQRDDDKFLAISAICTHLGCTVRSESETGGFFCPCHGSRFRRDGTNYAGPAPLPLDVFELSQADLGELIVDTRTKVSSKNWYRA